MDRAGLDRAVHEYVDDEQDEYNRQQHDPAMRVRVRRRCNEDQGQEKMQ